ncbi:YbaB/EbfC family nucleoid-associated protein [Plantactinospora sp. GCM10030261]|uniref:YbaB/EbfC family nucleoid-associated protein n=1 Tax=Plantactinospora sp. GCM10030261 TaxID=3273420 RepID=UPI0036130D60
MTGFPDGAAFLDPDSARDYLRSWQQRVDAMAAKTQAMSDQLAQLRITVQDDNGLVEVTVDATGVLVDLKLTQRIQRFDPAVVARTVMSTLRAAQLAAVARSREIAVETMGPDSTTAREVGDRMRRMLDQQDSTDGPPAPAPRRSRR